MDISSFFDKWDDDDDNKTSATAKAVSGSFQGQLCSITQKGSKFTYKLFITEALLEMVQNAMTDEGYVYVQVPGKVATAEVLDLVSVEGCVAVTSKNDGRVSLNAQEVKRVTPWKDLATKSKLAKEHIEMPHDDDDQKFGPPCLIYCDSVVPYATVPGLRRKVQPDHAELTWVSNKSFKEERRLSFQMVQRQWKTEDEFKAGPEPLTMQLKVWEDQCRQLGLTKEGDLKSWKALMAVHQIPFYALVRVNGEYSRGRPTISLSTMAVQWDLAACSSLVPMSADVVRKMYPKASIITGKAGDMINVTLAGKIPKDARFFALTSDPENLTSAELVAAASSTTTTIVVFALCNNAPAAPSAPKKAKK